MDYSFFIEIFLAIFFSGMIGLQRESLNRPAGLRTHILVCVGATISMSLNVLIMKDYPNIDPTRLGAAVISGIGFLGAGTIIKEGSSVSGLTTAAGLWAVACIGLLIGANYYLYAFITSASVFITLHLFGRLESKLYSSSKRINLHIISVSKPGQIGRIGTILGENDIKIKKIFISELENETSQLDLLVESNKKIIKELLVDILISTDGIISVQQR